MFRSASIAVLLLSLLTGSRLPCQVEPRNQANWKLAAKFSTEQLRKFVYSTSVRPTWIGKTELFWYAYKTSQGTRYWLVDPKSRRKAPLFDHEKLAAALSAAGRKPIEAVRLELTSLGVDEAVSKLSFVAGERRYEYELATGKLTDKGAAPRRPPTSGTPGRGDGQRLDMEEMRQRLEEMRRDGLTQEEMQRRIQEMQRQRDDQDQQREQQDQQRNEQDGRRGRGGPPSRGEDYRSLSPDGGAYVFAQGHDLYYVEGAAAPAAAKPTAAVAGEGGQPAAAQDAAKKAPARDGAAGPAAKAAPRFVFDEKKAVRLTQDGAEDYSFGRSSGSRTRGQGSSTATDPSRKSRPSVTWSKDGKSFFAVRGDSRGVQELFLVDSTAEPRPRLESYKYPMPGEEKVRRSELWVFDRARKKLQSIVPRWRDESYSNVHWRGDGHELRFVRRDRLQRNAELCAVDPLGASGHILLKEGVEDASLATASARYLDKRNEMIWWSERTGWGHFYLHDATTGALKHAITSGTFRTSAIVAVDEDRGQMWFRANGREPGENIYYEHLYRIDLDGSGLICLDPGNAHHRSELSPSRRFLVDNRSRVDAAPRSVLRDENGVEIIALEATDLSKLQEMGWCMPETFVVKAADGVTDLYGNLWKPFDFDAARRYPIIANVYPGPQQEGVNHTFSATSSCMQLAQLGFVVVQVGHRGGTPQRSKAYNAYGYYNLRDYGLEDKKAAIEQLADRYPFIDIDRVGIYGHSGGGFMTAAALMQKPYNDFFKVGVASSGNHDNNIYNNNWSERWHGLKEIAVEEKKGEGSGAGQRQRVRMEELPDVSRQGQGQGEKTQGQEKKTEGQDQKAQQTKFEIKVPTNAELAAGLKGHLLLVHGEIDNNVHPANTMRLVDALIKANKRFDMLILPGARHSFGRAQTYFQHRMWEYFAEHLLGDRQTGADILEKSPYRDR